VKSSDTTDRLDLTDAAADIVRSVMPLVAVTRSPTTMGKCGIMPTLTVATAVIELASMTDNVS